jgi:hypothetical protein
MSNLTSELSFQADGRRSDQRRILWALAAVGALVLLF